MKQVEIELLAAELLREKPDLKKLEKWSKSAGITWEGDLLELMAEVLKKIGRSRTGNKEVEI